MTQMGAFDMYHAVKLSKQNEERFRKLKKQSAKLTKRATRLEEEHAEALRRHFDDDVARFAVAFEQLKRCELEDVDVLGRVPAVKSLNAEARKVSVNAVQGLITVAGGAAAGAGAAAVTFAAVSALATASTGTAIAGLSGIVGTNAALAWLGGGSLAAGGMGVAGGTMVLAGIVGLPVILAAGGFLWWKGAKELSKQKAGAAELHRAKMVLERDSSLLDGVDQRIRQAGELMDRISKALAPLNNWLAVRVAENDDYRSFSEPEKQRLAIQVSLVMALTAIMAAPLVLTDKHAKGAATSKLSPGFKETLVDVDRMLTRLERDE